MNFHRYPHTYVGHVLLAVESLERSLLFYCDILGFKVLEQSCTSTVLTADGITPLVTLEQPDSIQPRNLRKTGLYHIAFLLPSRSELADILQYFIQIGYPLQGASDHDVSEALYLADPEGNGIEIYADRSPDTWSWKGGQVGMATVALQADSLLHEATGRSWTAMPSGTIIGHIHLQVSELEKTEEFYCMGLGFEPVARYGRQALFISSGKYHHHIGLNTWHSAGAPAPDIDSAGLKWFILVLPDEETRKQTVERLRQLHAPVEEEAGKVRTVDPNGIHLILQA
ncbi:VOC family protein [Paenibacillus popilliae]|uniref:Predicted ring-cleavage extradiol dioxygenase n=1 Tax=Paenibacillus popilliae ATCC 14706 TaxID=1212764 RepID=M9L9D7_PAEPP|nr:VOC family protein [Paenibacillus popilliae]GAC42012.1 predicted ring-cleavage extradiol dioxygenase [Paenibacillus popilliae ATCC 14706]